MSNHSPLMTVMVAAARKAGRALIRDFGELENLQVSRKGPADFVTRADLKAEETLFAELTKARPGYGFLGEERGFVEGTDKTHRWIVDPIDGTLNFMHGMPHFAISVGLEREGQLIAGIVYNPVRDELFWAEKGRGAWLNTRRLRVSARRTLAEAVVATGIPFLGKPGHAQFLKELHQIAGKTAGVRRFGSAALDLAWVAAGRFDAFWERDLKLWDIAAGVVLVREAGGICQEIDGADFMDTGSILAGSDVMVPLVNERLAAARG
jgi:myo-inositol-1(or 4)-monophosphatase